MLRGPEEHRLALLAGELPAIVEVSELSPNDRSFNDQFLRYVGAATISWSLKDSCRARTTEREVHRPMSTPEPPAPEGTTTSAPLTRLRGNTVDIDVRRLGTVIVGICLVTLLILVIVFTIVGAHNNNQINRLRHDGVPVTVKVTGCQGLLGGSGSNGAGYACTGTFAFEGGRHTESIPGSAFYAPGSTVRAVVVPGDPALMTPVDVLAGEHSSWRVFILPAVLLVVLALLAGAVLFRRRRGHPERRR
jgi:hypothetical protein